MRISTVISVLFHLCVVGLFYVVLPDYRRDLTVQPAVPFDIISEAELADQLSVPETRKDPEPVEEPPVPEEVLPEEVIPEEAPIEEAPVEKTPVEETPPPVEETPPPPVEEIPSEIPEEPLPPKEDPKPEPPKEPVKPKDDELGLDALEDALKDLDPDKTVAKPNETPGNPQASDRDQRRIGLGDQITANEEALIQAHLAKCWIPLVGAPEPEKLVVEIVFDLNPDGSLVAPPKIANRLQIRTSGNSYWIAAERRAISAVQDCAPYDFLPVERYDVWKEFKFNFRPPAA